MFFIILMAVKHRNKSAIIKLCLKKKLIEVTGAKTPYFMLSFLHKSEVSNQF